VIWTILTFILLLLLLYFLPQLPNLSPVNASEYSLPPHDVIPINFLPVHL